MRSGAHVDPLTRQFPAFRSTGRISNLNRICRGTFFIRLILLGLCAFSTVLQSIFSLSFLGVLVTDLSVGAPPAAEAPLCVFQVLREAICCVDLEGTW